MIIVKTAFQARGFEPQHSETCRRRILLRFAEQKKATRFMGGCVLGTAISSVDSGKIHKNEGCVKFHASPQSLEQCLTKSDIYEIVATKIATKM